MITDQIDGGDGDIRNPAPRLPLRGPQTARQVNGRRGAIIQHVRKAMGMGMSLPDAVHGLGVSATTVRRWLAERSAK